jgi:hypothetical protein
VGAQVAGDLAGPHGEPDQVDVGQVEVLDHRVEVGGERVVVVARGRPAGVAEAAAVIGDDAVSGGQQVTFLPLPGPSIQRVTMDQDDGLPDSVILVVDVDAGAVLAPDGDERHGLLLRVPGG